MTGPALALLSLGMVWGAFLLLRYRLSYLHLILAFLTVHALAVLYNGLLDGNPGPTFLMVMGLALTVTGMGVHRVVAGPVKVPSNGQLLEARSPTAYLLVITLFAVIVFAFVVYHYAIGGIPLFSSSVETLRFDLARSGLLGIPSRMQAIGILFVLFLLGTYAQRVVRRPRYARRLLLFMYGLTAITLLLSGFKSSLIVLIEVLVILNTYVPSWRYRERLSVRVLAVYSAVALLAVFVIAGVYAAARGVDIDIVSRVVERIFYVSGRPFYFVVTEFVPTHGSTQGHLLWLDVQYLLGQLGVISNYVDLTGSQVISSALHGRSSLVEFVVPTTINIFGWLYVEWGTAGLAVGSFVLGTGLSWLYYRPFRSRSILGQTCLLYLQLAVFVAVTRGNVGYAMGNRIVTLLFLVGLLLALTLIVFGLLRSLRPDFLVGRLVPATVRSAVGTESAG